jgi:hypothetical protein
MRTPIASLLILVFFLLASTGRADALVSSPIIQTASGVQHVCCTVGSTNCARTCVAQLSFDVAGYLDDWRTRVQWPFAIEAPMSGFLFPDTPPPKSLRRSRIDH